MIKPEYALLLKTLRLSFTLDDQFILFSVSLYGPSFIRKFAIGVLNSDMSSP